MSRATMMLLLMAMLATTQASMEFSIDTTWNSGPLDHGPVKLTLTGREEGSLELGIFAPFFNDPPNPGGKPGLPFFGLWEYEVVEAFFLNDDDQYLEVEVCPWGQHIVLMLAGQRKTIRHSLPLQVTTQRKEHTWTGTAIIPADYLPKSITKFNAYAIHGSGDNRIYEALYPAPSSAAAPDFHALQYFKPIDLSTELPSTTNIMSEFWHDALQAIFPYSIRTDWKGKHLNQEEVKITIQGFEAGVEMNVSAPFFNDPKPDGPPGPFFGLWDYEVVEMFFLNDNDEYLEVEVGPWGHHIVLLLQGERNTIEHSLELDYFANRGENTWTGSAMIPPTYFPPNVTRMNAYAIHGVGEKRIYQALYPAPANSAAPDFHRLELFQPLDFEYQVTDNSKYSDVWLDAIDSSMPEEVDGSEEDDSEEDDREDKKITQTTYMRNPSVIVKLRVDEETNPKEEEVNDILTSLGPLFGTEFTTEIPVEEEVTTLISFENPDEKYTENPSQKVGINQEDEKNPEQEEEKEVNLNMRPHTRRPSFTRPPTRRRPATQSPVRIQQVTRSPARRPSPYQINNSQRPIQNRRLNDNRHSSGNFLPDQKFPSEVLRPTQLLRPIQRPVPQIIERPPQEEIKFNLEDERLQISPEAEKQQKPNVQNEDNPQNLEVIVKDTTIIVPDTEDNSDITPQEENLQSAPLLPLELLPHPVCREAGLIPDRLRCMVFHECVIENGQWQMYSWRCKRGHYYDPHTVSCRRGRCNLG